MGVVADIGRSLRHGPRAVVREQLAQGANESRVLAFLMIGCFLVVVAQLPPLAHDAAVGADDRLVTPLARSLPPEQRSLDVMLAYTIMPWLLMAPLAFYAIAGVTHLVSRALGGQGTAFGARLAMFWSWLAATPLVLLTGLLTGFTGSSVLSNGVGLLWIAIFVAFWWQAQQEASRAPQPHGA
jgi:hypothetical protein